MADNGFIKLHKKMLKWEWYDDVNTCRLFIHCLLRANYEAGSWHGISYGKGQFITSLPSLAKETHLSVQQVRTALAHLKSTGELTDEQHPNCRVITINNWGEYQRDNRQRNRASTDDQQATNRASTAVKEYKEKKEDKEIKNIFIKPTLDEVRAYCNERQNGINPEQFVDYYESKGWLVGKTKMKDWKAAVRTWENNRKGDNVNEQPKGRVERNTQSREEYEAEMRELAKGLYGDDEE